MQVMKIFLTVIFIINAFIVVWAMIGYPVFLELISRIMKKGELSKNADYEPTVAIMVVAHNEEKVIVEKLNNLTQVDYPSNKLSIVVASDNSTDDTNSLVEAFIQDHPLFNITLYTTKDHKGKTNAQNEAQKNINAEILVMTDANCMFEKSAVKELVTVFSDSNVAYACGRTVFTNSDTNDTADSEATYWDYDSRSREIESRIQTITAGDGNIYACRNVLYEDIPLIECHDSSFPVRFALKGYRAVFEPKAIAHEKSGESNQDEYKRKVRMNRNLFHNILPSVKILNIFKYKWFTIFWLGHRTCRYLLWIAHIILFLSSLFMVPYGVFWNIVLMVQLLFYIVSLIGYISHINNKIIKMMSYYSMTVAAQWHGVYNIITGKAKPTWKKAESTR